MIVSGIKLLETKDNDLMYYTYNKFYLMVDLVTAWIVSNNFSSVHILCGEDGLFFVPEWCNYDLLLDGDAVFGAWLIRSLKQRKVTVVAESSLILWIGFLKAKVRSFLFGLRRLQLVSVRKWRWGVDKNLARQEAEIVIWARSASQARELISIVDEKHCIANHSSIFLQDDSFRKTDCHDFLASSGLRWRSIYSYISVIDIISGVLAWLKYRWIGLGDRSNSGSTRGVVLESVLCSPTFFHSVAVSLAESVFTGYLNTVGLRRARAEIGFELMLVLSNYDQWGGICSRLGKIIGYKTISIQNFAVDPFPLPNPYRYYDSVCVYDEMERDRLIKAGGVASLTNAVGSVAFDRLFDKALNERYSKDIRGRFSVAPESTLIVCATQSWGNVAYEDNRDVWGSLVELAKANTSVIGILKLHPYEKLEHYKKLQDMIDAQRLPIYIVAGEPIEPLIVACDIFVTRYSSTSAIAIILRKPVISILSSADQFALESNIFLGLGLSIIVSSGHAAVEQMTLLCDVTQRDEYCARLRARFSVTVGDTYDGRAGQRISAIIHRVLADKFSV